MEDTVRAAEMISQIHKGRDQTVALQSNVPTLNRSTSEMKFQHEWKTLNPGSFQSASPKVGRSAHAHATHSVAAACSTIEWPLPTAHRPTTRPHPTAHPRSSMATHPSALDLALYLNSHTPQA